MTSWNRGRENEEIGEQQLNDMDSSNDLEGMARKAGGEIEQGIDNVGDTLTGKQRDLKGKDRNHAEEAREWAEHRGDDVENAADRAGDWVENRGDDIKRKMD
jgi:uncharacterized protein YjbJ (UPF0337 family)